MEKDEKTLLNNARRNISREEYEKFLNDKSKLSFDQLEKLYAEENDPQMKAFYESLLAHNRELEEMRRLAAIEEELKSRRVKEKALWMGPPLYKRIYWKLTDMLGLVKVVGVKLAKPLSGFYEWVTDNAAFFLTVTAIGLLLTLLVITVMHDLGLSFGIVTLAALLLFGLGAAGYSDAYNAESKERVVMIFSSIAICLFSFMFFGKCLAPQRCYVGVATEEGQATRVIDSNDWWMDSPRWWRGEKIEWHDLFGSEQIARLGFSPRYDRTNVDVSRILCENFKREISINGAKGELSISCVKKVNLEGFKLLHANKKSVEDYNQELRDSVEKIIDKFVKAEMLDLKSMLQELCLVSNDIFSLTDLKGQINIMEQKTVEVSKEIEKVEVK